MDFDYKELFDDRRFARIRVCLEHGGLYDERPDSQTGRQQSCHDRHDQERWDGFDFNEWIRLCDCCLEEPLHSGSRWHTFFCTMCLPEIEESELDIPLGRHTLINGVGLPAFGVDGLVRKIESLADRMDRLARWKAEQVKKRTSFEVDPYLDEFVPYWHGSLSVSHDPGSPVDDLLEWWEQDYYGDMMIATDAKSVVAKWKADYEARQEGGD